MYYGAEEHWVVFVLLSLGGGDERVACLGRCRGGLLWSPPGSAHIYDRNATSLELLESAFLKINVFMLCL
jgi:hypothetical protein